MRSLTARMVLLQSMLLCSCLWLDIGSGQMLEPDGSGMGSGSGDRQQLLSPFTCTSESMDMLQLEVFDVLVTKLTQLLGCSPTESNEQLLYTIDQRNRDPIEIATVTDTVDEYFDLGTHDNVQISVCLLDQANESLACDVFQTEIQEYNTTILVNMNTKRLFPYGFGDKRFSNIDDSTVGIVSSDGIPFFTATYNRIHISSNGLLSFMRPFRAWWATPIPFGRYRDPIIAPYWSDIDFRNGLPNTGVYYRIYRNGDMNDRRTSLVLQEFSRRLATYTNEENIDFIAEWLMVVTWKDGTPYYGRANRDEIITFQLVLATDYLATYAYFLYDESTWSLSRRFWPRVVIGHDAYDYTNYRNIKLPSSQYLRIHREQGNTGRPGEWYFNYTTSGQIDSAKLCMKWSQRQDSASATFEGMLSCPCTQRQARRDWRFWFGYYWGFSARPNCATLRFSWPSQSSVECCYDNDGSLIVGTNEGGSYMLYNPLFRYRQNFQEDRLPHRQCCEESKLCHVYYQHRPSDDCSNYTILRPFWTFGDPHFVSVDKNNFTFNGIGEYRLLESPSKLLNIQSRLVQYEDTSGSVMSAIAIQQGNIDIQVEAESSLLKLYIEGNPHPLPTGDEVFIVTANGVNSILNNGLDIQMVALQDSLIQPTMSEQLSIQVDDTGVLVITMPFGATVMVALQMTFLQATVVLTNAYLSETRGLMGVFNGDPSDDFTLPNRTVLAADLTEAEVYNFGLEWHVSESESIFQYFNDASYSTYNSEYLTFMPTFTSELVDNLPSDVDSVCGGDQACIYDYAISGNPQLGNSTQLASQNGQDLEAILSNRPPNITGSFILYVKTGESVSEMYNADDPDGDAINNFSLKDSPTDVSITFDMAMTFMDGWLHWRDPGYNVPSGPIMLFANDSKGAASTRRISIVLCGCQNGGSCVEVNDRVEDIPFDENGHYKQLCECPEFFGGDSCEVELRGCDYSVCPDSNICQPNASEPSGYICTGCSDGYTKVDSKCIDINECLEMEHNCSQLQQCVNTEGGFSCECRTGYRSTDGGRTCEDIDECAEALSSCSQLCNNTEGSYTCSCHSGYSLAADGATCFIKDNCQAGSNLCDGGMCTRIGVEYKCVCPLGQRCDGTCTGNTPLELQSGMQSCQVCMGQQYGYECSQTCNCMNGGSCNNTVGCVCSIGWTGTDCTIELNNHTPVFDDVAPVTLNWTAEAGYTLAQVNASDGDGGPNAGSITFSLVRPEFPPSSGVSDGLNLFNITSMTGVITLTDNLLNHVDDFSEILLTVKAQDRGSPPRTAITVLSVVLVPVPVLTFSSRVQVPESAPENSNLTSVSCVEQGRPSNSLRLNLQGNYSRFFSIDITSSQLSLVRKLDFESLPNRSDPFYRLDVICENQFGLSDKRQIEIEVLNVDDNPLVFGRSFYSASVMENAQHNTSVLNISASDEDLPDGTVNYAIVNMDRNFTIGTTSGRVVVAADLDYETQDSYSFIVRAELSGSSIEVPVNVSILDINEPPAFLRQLYSINDVTTMNRIGDRVFTLVADDPDFGENGRIMYTLESNSFFVINETTGAIYVESTLRPNLELTLVVNASDNGEPRLISSTMVHISVQSSPQGVRFNRMNYDFVIEEDQPRGALIGRVEASVFDDRNVTLNDDQVYPVSYSIVNGSNTFLFTIIPTTGEIFLLSTLDFDLLARRYMLTVRALHTVNDELRFTDEAVVFINVSDVNDNPPRFMPSAYAIAVEEFTPTNSSIVIVSATDADTMSQVTYSIQGDDAGPFQINAQSGVISNREELLIARDYRFFVTASDGELSSMAVVFISVTRSVSVEPTFTRERYIFNLLETANRGSFVGTVEAVTRGTLSSLEFDHLRFRIVTPDPVTFNGTSQAGDSLFHIDGTSGNISTLSDFEFDAENRTTYIFFVQVYSTIDDTVYDTTTVAVELADANDNSPVFTQPLYTRVIETTIPVSSVILRVSASDRDSTTNSEITYSIEPISFNFTIDRTSGEISAASSSLTTGNYRLTVVATDKGSPPLNGTATVVIAIIPTVPSNLSFTSPIYRFSVPENAAANTLVGRVEVLDAAPGTIMYSTSNLDICLHVSPNDGDIRVSCSLDRETEPRYELQVLASARDGDAFGYGTVIVDVLDINDNPPKFSLDIYAEVIDDQFGNTTAILQVSSRDSDHGENSSISYTFTPTVGELVDTSEYFRINESSGAIYLRDPTIPIGDYRLTVQAADGGMPQAMTATALVLVCVIRARPSVLSFNTSTTLSVEENQLPFTPVGRAVLLTAGGEINPADFSNNLQFSIVRSDSIDSTNVSLPLFGIIAGTGDIYTLRSLDREMADRHVVVVLANFTQFGLAEEASLNIAVTDLNDNSPQFEPMQYSAIIEENTENTTTFINVTIVDLDVGLNSEIELTLNGLLSNPFGIRVRDVRYPYTYGEIFVQNHNLLLPGQYDFEITASDRGAITRLSSVAQVYITVEHSPPDFLSFSEDPYVFEITENSIRDTFVGTVSIEQPITPALDGLIYSIEGGRGVGYFAIDSTSGNITNLRTIDRELVQQLNLTVTVRVTSQPSLVPARTTVVINIGDVNDNVPAFSSGSYSTMILESDLSVGISLVQVIVSDADSGSNAALLLSVEDISTHGLPSNFYITRSGDIFTNTTYLNATTYFLRVTARDSGVPPLSSSTFVSITVQLPVPTEIQFLQPNGYVFNVTENEASGPVIGAVELQPLPAHVVQFVTFMDNINEFQVSHAAGEIRAEIQTLNVYDYESRQSYRFQVEAQLSIPTRSPPVDLRTTVNVTVFVIDINDNAPMFVNFPTTLSYLENRTREEMVYHLQSTDADSGANAERRYEILNVDIRNKFRIDSMTGELFIAARVDREERSSYDITVQLTDSGTPSMSAQNTIRFNLLDINDNIPRMINGFTISVRERVPPPNQLVQLQGFDPDLGNNGTFDFSKIQTYVFGTTRTPSNPVISVLTNGTVTLASELDYESVQSYTIHIRIADRGNPRLQFTYTNVTLRVVNQPDNVPQFNASTYQYNTQPRLTSGATLARVFATDGDPMDVITYEIDSVITEGNGGQRPDFRIDTRNGRIYHSGNRNVTPEANFSIRVSAYDNSIFNLSDNTVVNISVLPERLQFTQTTYSVQLLENASIGANVITVPLQELSVSSSVTYAINVLQPVGQSQVFRVIGSQRQSQAIVQLARRVNREDIDSYTVNVIARRSGEQDVTATVTITLVDVNDNPPVFSDPRNSVITVMEDETQQVITNVNATDGDIGSNSRLHYELTSLGSDPVPFTIDRDTGYISLVGTLDYETRQSYTLTVQVSDSGNPPLRASQDYIIQLKNINDNFPTFSANAYFGEIYIGAAVGDYVLHTQVRVTDEDGDEPKPSFRISFPIELEREYSDLYAFEVTPEEPHFIRVVRLPDEATVTQSQLLELEIEAIDRSLTNSVKLYISVFTSSHLIRFRLAGVSIISLLSCEQENFANSICGFRTALDRESTSLLGSEVHFYNTSIQVSRESIVDVDVVMYGWYGSYQPRDNFGELPTDDRPPPVQYINYREQLFEEVVKSNLFNPLTYRVEFIPNVATTPPLATEPPTVEEGLSMLVIVGVAVGGALAALVIVLMIVVVVVFGRGKRKTNKSKKKKKKRGRRSSDMYDRPYDRSYDNRYLDKKKGKSRKDSEKIALTTKSVDQAYETMFDNDDDMLGNKQTMPWFDPNYLAPNRDDDSYDGDVDQSTNGQTDGNGRGGGLGLRATVDGDARRRKYSSDEEESVTELSRAQETHLQSYQQSTPMQPGQRMGEYDMFAKPREPDRPFRPSLPNQWGHQAQQQYQAAPHTTSRF